MNICTHRADFLFRGLFCLIFVGLGGEHIFSDELIQKLMPYWIPYPRTVSLACGVWLLGWGMMIALGWKLKWAAYGLGVFLLVVTAGVHLPGIFNYPADLPESQQWMWDILQRTNLVKNLCLLGVCFHLLHHECGKYSLEYYLKQKNNS